MDILGQVLLYIYLLATALLITISLNCFVMVFLFKIKEKSKRLEAETFFKEFVESGRGYPAVTTQIAIFNELNVAERIIRSVADLDYPEGKHFIQVLDDSTDETYELIQTVVADLNTEDGNIVIVLVVAGHLENRLQRLIDTLLKRDRTVTNQFLHETLRAEHLAVGIILFDRTITVEVDAVALLIGDFLQIVIGIRDDPDGKAGGLDLHHFVVADQDRWRMSGGNKLKCLVVRIHHRVATGEEFREIPIRLE